MSKACAIAVTLTLLAMFLLMAWTFQTMPLLATIETLCNIALAIYALAATIASQFDN